MEGLCVDMQKTITSLFSHSTTFSEVSCAARSDDVAITSSYNTARAEKVVVEKKLLCNDKKREHQKYVIMFDFLIWKGEIQNGVGHDCIGEEKLLHVILYVVCYF